MVNMGNNCNVSNILHIIPIIWAQRYENGLENIYYTTKYFLQNVVRYKDNGYLCTLKRKILYI